MCNFFRVHSEISQFIDGLNRVGNFHTSAILRAAKEFKTLFTPNPVNQLTFSGLRQLYKIEFSPVGSNHRQQDEAIYCFESFCSDCEGKFMLKRKFNLHTHVCISRKQSLYNKLHYTYKLYKTPLKYFQLAFLKFLGGSISILDWSI